MIPVDEPSWSSSPVLGSCDQCGAGESRLNAIPISSSCQLSRRKSNNSITSHCLTGIRSLARMSPRGL